jgi:PAS domain S-box-containing protein
MNWGVKWGDFTPHGFCLAWDPGLIWLQAGSDLAITLAYYSIPAALLVFLRRRRDLAFRPVFGLFAAFILACGTTHLMGVITLWQPAYWLDGGIKAITAALSVATAVMLWPLLPKALALPSPAALREVNEKLARQITERDAALEQLRLSEARLRDLFVRAPAALHATDPYGTLLDVSDRWLALMGYARDEVLGRNMTAFYTGNDVATVQADLAAMRAGGGPRMAERVVQRRNGEQRIVEAQYEVERNARGLQRVLVALTDITARKQAEAALRASEERLRHAQKMEAVGQLTGGIAHDFNNLLTTIMGSLEMLERRPALDDRGQRLAANALEGARRAARLTGQLLSFSRRARLEPESLAPAAVVDGIRDMLEKSVGERVTLVMPPPDSAIWPVMADRNQLEMALLNLVLNARDAITGHGSITISFRNTSLALSETDQLTPDPMAPGDYVGIAVADTGCGMAPDVLAHAFEPFFTTKKTGAGTGLGLAQTYGFATQSGGTVHITSEIGAGTRVEIILPRAAMQVAAGAGRDAPGPTATIGRGETILVVEDDALLRHTVSAALEDHGYAVIATPHGAAALAVLESGRKLDLLFTDVMMPGGMSGVDVAMAARAARPELKVIFATGYSDRRTLEQWPETLDLIPKPYALTEVAQRIARRLAVPAVASGET